MVNRAYYNGQRSISERGSENPSRCPLLKLYRAERLQVVSKHIIEQINRRANVQAKTLREETHFVSFLAMPADMICTTSSLIRTSDVNGVAQRTVNYVARSSKVCARRSFAYRSVSKNDVLRVDY